MSIEVEGPDGAINEFPDGTAPEIIKGAMSKRYAQQQAQPQSQGMWDTIKEQGGRAAQAADDVVRLMANGATGGYADKIAAYMNGGQVDQERALTDAAQDRAGIAGHAASLIGSLGPSGAISKGLGVAGVTAPYVNALGTGAIMGAGDAMGHDTDPLTGAAIGAGAGVAGQAVANALTGTVGKIAGAFNKKPSVPTSDDLSLAVSDAYARADAAGGIVNASATQRLADALRGRAADFGYDPAMQPMTGAFLRRMEDYEGQNLTMKGLDTLRKIAGRTYEGGPSDKALGGQMKSEIDRFASGLGHGDVMPGAGDAQGAAQAFSDARSVAARSFKDQDLQAALESAKLRAASTGSGGNSDNATRQNVRRLLESNTAWTPDERAALETIAKGTPLSNSLRLAGKASPEGNGLSMMLHLGAVLPSGGMSLPVAAAGAASKRIADAMTERAAQRAGDIIRSGGNASALQPAPNAVQQLAESQRDLLARALMGGTIGYALPAIAQ